MIRRTRWARSANCIEPPVWSRFGAARKARTTCFATRTSALPISTTDVNVGWLGRDRTHVLPSSTTSRSRSPAATATSGARAPTTATATSGHRVARRATCRTARSGRSRSRDPNVPKNEPLDPDDRSTSRSARTCVAHQIRECRNARSATARRRRASTTTRVPVAIRAATAP
jgi:hypothetical protein